MKKIIILVLFTIVTVIGISQTVVTLQLPDNCNANGIETKKPSQGSIQVVPNPNNGQFTLKVTCKNTINKATIAVFSMDSKKVYSEKVYGNSRKMIKSLNLSFLKEGVYLIKLKNESGSYSVKLIINK